MYTLYQYKQANIIRILVIDTFTENCCNWVQSFYIIDTVSTFLNLGIVESASLKKNSVSKVQYQVKDKITIGEQHLYVFASDLHCLHEFIVLIL